MVKFAGVMRRKDCWKERGRINIGSRNGELSAGANEWLQQTISQSEVKYVFFVELSDKNWYTSDARFESKSEKSRSNIKPHVFAGILETWLY